ncbi:MAG: AraC family transcriptional regulator [Clostridia bacterium]|nr:AraC family transcriptional regulator [Clostridia bacterium]
MFLLCRRFFDEYHFSKQFKKIVGMSPTEYRKIVFSTKIS